MPLALVSSSKRVNKTLLRKVIKELPNIIAAHLDCPPYPHGGLKPEDVEVQYLKSPFDIGHMDVQVTILALKFEERIQTGQLRTDDIVLAIQKLLPAKMKCFAFLLLQSGFFSHS